MPTSPPYSILLIIGGSHGSQCKYITCCCHDLPVFVVEFNRIIYDGEDYFARNRMVLVQVESCEDGNTVFPHFVRSGPRADLSIDRFDQFSNAIRMGPCQPSQCMKYTLQNSSAPLVESGIFQHVPHEVGHCMVEIPYIT